MGTSQIKTWVRDHEQPEWTTKQDCGNPGLVTWMLWIVSLGMGVGEGGVMSKLWKYKELGWGRLILKNLEVQT